MIVYICLFFFFSSRRRHTRWTGDWSSDVCSSDLVAGRGGQRGQGQAGGDRRGGGGHGDHGVLRHAIASGSSGGRAVTAAVAANGERSVIVCPVGSDGAPAGR